MIIKFDGVDGCGKSTLSRAVADALKTKGARVALVSEFSSPAHYPTDSIEPVPIGTMLIRETALAPTFDCDDVERQLLLHFLSRRKNRVEIPYLATLNDFVVVDRSTLSNYAYAEALSPKFVPLTKLAVGGVETADQIFWIDTPVDLCIERMSTRISDAVERKGRGYLEQVHALFEKCVSGTIRRLDGGAEISALVEEVLAAVEV